MTQKLTSRVSNPVPKVTVITLNWNTFEVSKECLESLRRVEYPNLEVIVVDNGSTDGSPELLAQCFPEVKLIRNPRNLGFAGGNNVGMRHALSQSSDYLLLLNNDTAVSPNFLAELVRVGESDRLIGILNPKIYYFDPPDAIWYAGGCFSPWRGFARHVGQGQLDQRCYDEVREVTFITGCALLIKTSVVREIGLLDESFFMICEDADWSIRALRAGFKAVYVPTAVIWHKESYTVKQKVGKWLRDFYNMRNSVLLARKHARFYHWPSFLFFLSFTLAYRTTGYVLRQEFNRVSALYRGLWAGLQAPSPLPTLPGATKLPGGS